jgi:hypothetical protein
MPAVSAKQERFMQAVANNPKFAKKVGVPTSVGREFTKGKDMKKMKKMAGGGMPMGPDGKPTFVGDGKGKMAKGGMAKAKMGPSKMGKVATGKPAMGSASKRADGVAVKGKTKGKILAKGGMTKMRMGGAC